MKSRITKLAFIAIFFTCITATFAQTAVEQYVKYRKTIITNRTKYDLKKAKDRQEIVEGLLVALKNIDDIIILIKKSKTVSEALEGLIKKYNLTKKQAQAVLETKLQQLTS